MPKGIYKHKPLKEEIKRKISFALAGKKKPEGFGFNRFFSEETRKKMSKASKGKKKPPFSEETKKRMSESHKTIVHTKEWNEKVSKSLKGKPQPLNCNEKHYGWKGEKAGYTAFHQWLQRKYGRATKCENPCHTFENPKRFEWALIHGKEHGHHREGYWQLCKSCHRKYDNTKLL